MVFMRNRLFRFSSKENSSFELSALSSELTARSWYLSDMQDFRKLLVWQKAHMDMSAANRAWLAAELEALRSRDANKLLAELPEDDDVDDGHYREI